MPDSQPPAFAQQAPFRHRSQHELTAQEITHITRVMPTAPHAIRRLSAHAHADRRLLRDNTLHAIRLYQKAYLGDPGHGHSTPPCA
jgi:hypothetical protein